MLIIGRFLKSMKSMRRPQVHLDALHADHWPLLEIHEIIGRFLKSTKSMRRPQVPLDALHADHWPLLEIYETHEASDEEFKSLLRKR